MVHPKHGSPSERYGLLSLWGCCPEPTRCNKAWSEQVKLKICRLRVCRAGASPEPAHLGTTVTPCAGASSDLTADPRTFNLGVPAKMAGGALILTRSARLFLVRAPALFVALSPNNPEAQPPKLEDQERLSAMDASMVMAVIMLSVGANFNF